MEHGIILFGNINPAGIMKQLLLLLLLSSLLFATSVPVRKIRVTGTRKTKESTVLSIAKLNDQTAYCDPDTVQQRLRNRELFAEVKVSYDTLSQELTISLKDSWSIQPVLSAKMSAKTFNFQAGLYDINFLGKDIVIGGQYDNYAESHNVKVSFRKNNLGSRRISLGIAGTKNTRNYVWYNKERGLDAGFQVDKQILSLTSQLPFLIKGREFKLGFICDFLQQESSTDKVADTLKTINTENGYTFQDTLKAVIPNMTLLYSTININNYIADGWATKLSITRSIVKELKNYSSLSFQAQYYRALPGKSNLCINGYIKGLNSSRNTALYYVGHSNAVRGFWNSEFKGKAYAQLNSEVRISQINMRFFKRFDFIVQPALFWDLLSIGERPSNFFDTNQTVTSVGSGIRIVSPSFSGFMLNADFAVALGDYPAQKGNKRYNYYVGTSYYFRPLK